MTSRAVPRIDLIHAAARRHFALHGYDGASMRDVAADSGITIATLYFHCGTKEQLLFDVLEERLHQLLSGSMAAVAQVSGTWSDRLAAAIRFHVRFTARPEEGAAISTSELRGLTGDLRARHLVTRDAYERHVREIVQGGIGASEFAPVDVAVVTAGIIGMCLTVGRWYRGGGRLTPDEIADEYIHFTLRGLSRDAVSPERPRSRGNGRVVR
jgi:TetR/AcrR family transcriptional regulator, cholesterol catabolism regulator